MDMREAFETWVQTDKRFRFDDISLSRCEEGFYKDGRAQEMWTSWQAALSHIGDGSKAEPVSQEVIESAWDNRFGKGYIKPTPDYISGFIDGRASRPAPTAQDSKVPEEWGHTLEDTIDFVRDRASSAWDHKLLDKLQAMLSAAPVPEKPQRVSCEERLPTAEDGDFLDQILAYNHENKRWEQWSVESFHIMRGAFTHWMPTGLQRPAAPEGE